jgi:hypothetical protein
MRSSDGSGRPGLTGLISAAGAALLALGVLTGCGSVDGGRSTSSGSGPATASSSTSDTASAPSTATDRVDAEGIHDECASTSDDSTMPICEAFGFWAAGDTARAAAFTDDPGSAEPAMRAFSDRYSWFRVLRIMKADSSTTMVDCLVEVGLDHGARSGYLQSEVTARQSGGQARLHWSQAVPPSTPVHVDPANSDAGRVLADFFTAWSDGDYQRAADLTDDPGKAGPALRAAHEGFAWVKPWAIEEYDRDAQLLDGADLSYSLEVDRDRARPPQVHTAGAVVRDATRVHWTPSLLDLSTNAPSPTG